MRYAAGFLQALSDAILIRRSGLLHVTYYRSQFYQELKADRYLLRLSPVLHYVLFGARAGKNPNPLFDSEYYRDHNPGADQSGQNPLAHYLRQGARDRLDPGPFFDTGYYCDGNPGIANEGLNPLVHYFRYGKREEGKPHPLVENLVRVDEPHAVDWTTGRNWLQQGLGPSSAVGAPCPLPSPGPSPVPHPGPHSGRIIRFEWDRGGWNNIRMQAEVLVCLAARYGRALVLPDADQWYLIPGVDSHLFHYFDEAAFREAVPVLPADTRREDEWEVPAELASINTVRLNRGAFQSRQDHESWYFPRTTRMFGCFSAVLGSSGSDYALLNRAFRLRPDLIDLATGLLQSNGLEPGGYLAAHVRRGDFQPKVMRYLSTAEIVGALRGHGADAAGKVLIVSDEYDEALLDACRNEGWEPVCWAGQPSGDARLSGVLDMLACCPAWRFVGTNLSTFSTGIMQWRGKVSRVAHGSIDAVPRFTNTLEQIPWWAAVDEFAWLST